MKNDIKFLSNDNLKISISRHGAELSSIQFKGNEYLWQADPKFWKRHSPVLFPIVGSVCDGRFFVDGQEYKMSQHGFARDMDFELLAESDHEIWYQLKSDAQTLEKFPYEFILQIGYKIENNSIKVMWKVVNPSSATIHFQIGAHPAFYYRGEEQSGVKGYFGLKPTGQPNYILIKGKGCADVDQHYCADLDADGHLPIKADTFSKDALIFEDSQLNEVTLFTANRKPYLSVGFDAPVVGLWAPSADSPFVCIEPWYGRCDRFNFNGEFKEKDWVEHLEAGKTFEGGYTITLL